MVIGHHPRHVLQKHDGVIGRRTASWWFWLLMRQVLGVPMAGALRKTGIPLMEEIPWGLHIALFYETRADLFDTCAAYFGAGLQNNEFCTWAVADSVTVEVARQALREGIPDFERHEAAGDIELMSGRDLNVPDHGFDLPRVLTRWRNNLQRAMERGYQGLRMSSHAWVAASQSQLYIEEQRHLAEALEGRPMLAMGTYELGGSRAVDVLDVVSAHDLTIARRRGDWQIVETPDVKQANARNRQLADVHTAMSAPFPGYKLLTEREHAVLAQIVKGASSKEIARELGVSPRTVDFHRANILQKFGARNTAEVIRVVLNRA
jgi:DNA-binding CsgD family transcriptional regulator